MDMFNGKSLRVKKGYMYCGHKVVHREIWKSVHGPIPPGHHIHHKDGNKLNNSIENLECISQSEHMSLHAKERREQLSKCMSKNNEKLHAWHRSTEGKKSLSEKSKKEFQAREFKTYTCVQCNKEFQSNHTTDVKFCSDNCVMKARRLSKVDDETRKCIICSADFIINKYWKTVTCSWDCRNKHLSNLKRKRST